MLDSYSQRTSSIEIPYMENEKDSKNNSDLNKFEQESNANDDESETDL